MIPIAPLLAVNSALKLVDMATTRIADFKLERTPLKELEAPPPFTGKADNHPDNIYSTVKVNGEVVATLYKGGSVMMTNAAYAEAKGLPSMGEKETLVGIPLAEKRAAEIAKALGGTIEKATATASSSTSSQPPLMVKFDTDLSRVQEWRNAAANTRFHTQLLAQSQWKDFI